jgi:hypothetical protein
MRITISAEVQDFRAGVSPSECKAMSSNPRTAKVQDFNFRFWYLYVERAPQNQPAHATSMDNRMDRLIGVYQHNEMLHTNETPSQCTAQMNHMNRMRVRKPHRRVQTVGTTHVHFTQRESYCSPSMRPCLQETWGQFWGAQSSMARCISYTPAFCYI